MKPTYYTLSYDISNLQYCCGVQEFGSFYWNDEFDGDDFYHTFVNRVPQEDFDREIANITRSFKRQGCKTVLCNIIDKRNCGFEKYEHALLNAGWTELFQTKSNHGRYMIHTFVWRRPVAAPRKK